MEIFGMDPLYFVGGVLLVAAIIYGFVLHDKNVKGGGSNNNTSTTATTTTTTEGEK